MSLPVTPRAQAEAMLEGHPPGHSAHCGLCQNARLMLDLADAADKAASWIENYPLNDRTDFLGDWTLVEQELRAVLARVDGHTEQETQA